MYKGCIKDVYLNLSTIVVGEIKYNNQPVECPPNQSRYYKNLDRIHVKIIIGMFYQDDVIAGISTYCENVNGQATHKPYSVLTG